MTSFSPNVFSYLIGVDFLDFLNFRNFFHLKSNIFQPEKLSQICADQNYVSLFSPNLFLFINYKTILGKIIDWIFGEIRENLGFFFNFISFQFEIAFLFRNIFDFQWKKWSKITNIFNIKILIRWISTGQEVPNCSYLRLNIFNCRLRF